MWKNPIGIDGKNTLPCVDRTCEWQGANWVIGQNGTFRTGAAPLFRPTGLNESNGIERKWGRSEKSNFPFSKGASQECDGLYPLSR